MGKIKSNLKSKYTNNKSTKKYKFVNGGPEWQNENQPTSMLQDKYDAEQRKIAEANAVIFGQKNAALLNQMQEQQLADKARVEAEAEKRKEQDDLAKQNISNAGAINKLNVKNSTKKAISNFNAPNYSQLGNSANIFSNVNIAAGAPLSPMIGQNVTGAMTYSNPIIRSNSPLTSLNYSPATQSSAINSIMPEGLNQGVVNAGPTVKTTAQTASGLGTALTGLGLNIAGEAVKYGTNRSQQKQDVAAGYSDYKSDATYTNKEFAGQVIGSTLKGAGTGIGIGSMVGGVGAVPAALIGGAVGLTYGLGKAIHEKRATTAEQDRGIKIGDRTYGKKLLFGDENVYSESKDPNEIARKNYEDYRQALQRVGNAADNALLSSRKSEINTGFSLKTGAGQQESFGYQAKYGGNIKYLKGGVAKSLGRGAVEYVGKKHEHGGIDLPGNIEVEGGETEQNDYIFSATLKLPNGATYAQAHKNLIQSGATGEEIHQLALSQEAAAGRNPNEIKSMKFAKYGGPLQYDKGGRKERREARKEEKIIKQLEKEFYQKDIDSQSDIINSYFNPKSPNFKGEPKTEEDKIAFKYFGDLLTDPTERQKKILADQYLDLQNYWEGENPTDTYKDKQKFIMDSPSDPEYMYFKSVGDAAKDQGILETPRPLSQGDIDFYQREKAAREVNTANQTVTPTPSPVVTQQKSSYTMPGFDMNRSFGQISNNEQNYFRTEANLKDPDWRNQRIDNSGGRLYNTPQKVESSWNNILTKTKKDRFDSYSDMPAPLKDIAMDHLFNAKTDPRIFTLAAAGVDKGYTGEGEPTIQNPNYRKWLETNTDKLWKDNKDLIKQQYNDDPQAFTESVSDYRKVLYSRMRTDDLRDANGQYVQVNGKNVLTDYPSVDETTKEYVGPGVQYNAWAGRTDNLQNMLNDVYFNQAKGYTSPEFFKDNASPETVTTTDQTVNPTGVPATLARRNDVKIAPGAPVVDQTATTNTASPGVTYTTSDKVNPAAPVNPTDAKPRFFMGANRILDENGNVQILTDRPLMGTGAMAGSRLGTPSAEGLDDVINNPYAQAASIKEDANYTTKNTGSKLSYSKAVSGKEDIAQTEWGKRWGYRPGMTDAEAKAAHDAFAAEMRSKFDQSPDEMLGYYQYIIDAGAKIDDQGNRTYSGEDAYGDDARAIFENLKSKGYIDANGKIKKEALSYLKTQATNEFVGPIHNAAGAYTLKGKPTPVKIQEIPPTKKPEETPPPIIPPYLPPYKDYTTRNNLGLLQTIPPIAAAFNPLKAERVNAAMVPYSIRPAAVGNVNLGRMSYNAERAANQQNLAAMSQALQGIAGPGSVAGMLAAKTKADQQSMQIAQAEKNTNVGIANQEAGLNAEIAKSNAQSGMQAQTANAEIAQANAQRAQAANQYNSTMQFGANQENKEQLLGAIDTGVQAITQNELANRQLAATERLAGAMDYTGSYDRRLIYENLVKGSKDKNSELYGKSASELMQLVPYYDKQFYGDRSGVVVAANTTNNTTKKFGGIKKYISRLGDLNNNKTFKV